VGVLQFSLLRARALNMRVHIEWVWTVPIIKETINKKS
jgi:hypothetical protein